MIPKPFCPKYTSETNAEKGNYGCQRQRRQRLKGDLDGKILPTICRMRHAYAMPTTRTASCKSTYNILTTDAHHTKNVVGF